MPSSPQVAGFAHYSADNQQLRYQRNTGIISDVSAMDMGRCMWYRPLAQLAQPLMVPSAHLNNFHFGAPNQFPPPSAHMNQIALRPLEQYRGQTIPQQTSPIQSGQTFETSDHSLQDEAMNVVSMDEDTTVHGNWTTKNAKFRLFCFCEANGYPLAYIHVEEGHSSKIKNRPWMHRCRKVLNLNQLYKITKSDEMYERRRHSQLRHVDKIIEGDGKGQTRKEASEKCALSLIQHLYQLELIEAHIAPVKLRKKKEFQLETYKVAISGKLGKELDAVLKVMKIKSYILPQREVIKNTTVVLKSQKLQLSEIKDIAAFTQFVIPTWCPPCEKWDPWLNCKITEGALADMSMDQIGNDLRNARFRQVESESSAQQMLNERLKLPIFNCIGKIMDAVQNNSVIIVQGPNGCGKSTQVPQYILDAYINAGRGGECSIIVIQPRRVSTVNIAERIARERGESMGTSCGYSIRFDSWLPRPYGSILFCTADVVLKKLKSGLRGISHVIVDEIHERDVNVDFILLVLREMMRIYCNLRVILLSAPMEITLFSEYFSDCRIIEVPTGQPYPVTDFYLEDCIEMVKFVPPPKNINKNTSKAKGPYKEDSDDDEEENMNKVIGKNYLKSTAEGMAKINEEEIPFELIEALLMHINFQNVPGAVLIFLPGWNEVSQLKNRLQQHSTFGGPSYLILPLHSQLRQLEVHRVFETAPPGVTKIILSSSIGESGITINDVVYVIDSCKIKLKRFSSHEIFFNSAVVWASKRNLEQRRGRAGRTQAGTCFRLCSRARFEKLKDDMPAAISYIPLDELALTIKFLRLGNVYHFLSQALQPPPLYLILQAETLLRGIGAVDKNGDLTSLGSILGQLPVRPQLGKMIILSCLFQLGDPFCTIIPRTGIFMELFDPAFLQQLSYARENFQGNHCSDFVTLLNAFTQWEKAQNHGKHTGNYFCEEYCFSKSAMEITMNAKRQLKGILQAVGFPGKCMAEQDYTSSDSDTTLDMITALLLVGYHPNVCFYNMHSKKFIINGTVIVLDNSSLYNVKDPMQFSKSPFFVFEERIHTKPHCKEMTVVTPIQLLLFGHSRVEIVDGIVVLDGWIKLKIDLQLASKLLALRKQLDSVLIEVVSNPSLVNSESVHRLVSVIKDLCSRSAIIYSELQ